MTENEAIKILKDEHSYGYELNKACLIAIKALEKQVPKKVYHFIDDDTFETTCCGTDVTNEDFKYCPNCGSLLGEVEELKEEEYGRYKE